MNKRKRNNNLTKIYKTDAVLPPVSDRYTKEQLQDIIEKNYGVITIICGEVDCTPRQLYNALDKFELRDYIKECKKNLVGLAETAIIECLMSQNETVKLKAAETTLKSLGKDSGWDQNPQVQIAQQINVNDEAKLKEIFGIQ